jgi:predicted glutamine amidotransferase
MCRWLAYSGSPILLDELLLKTDHSLIDQSLHARLGVETTNGDGFGVGWYGARTERPAVFRSVEPAWNDRNVPRRVRPSSRPTAIRSATAGGSGSTTAS